MYGSYTRKVEYLHSIQRIYSAVYREYIQPSFCGKMRHLQGYYILLNIERYTISGLFLHPHTANVYREYTAHVYREYTAHVYREYTAHEYREYTEHVYREYTAYVYRE